MARFALFIDLVASALSLMISVVPIFSRSNWTMIPNCMKEFTQNEILDPPYNSDARLP